MGIGYRPLKLEWIGDIPQTVITTGAPTVLKMQQILKQENETVSILYYSQIRRLKGDTIGKNCNLGRPFWPKITILLKWSLRTTSARVLILAFGVKHQRL